jgi:hypothetical protein
MVCHLRADDSDRVGWLRRCAHCRASDYRDAFRIDDQLSTDSDTIAQRRNGG